MTTYWLLFIWTLITVSYLCLHFKHIGNLQSCKKSLETVKPAELVSLILVLSNVVKYLPETYLCSITLQSSVLPWAEEPLSYFQIRDSVIRKEGLSFCDLKSLWAPFSGGEGCKRTGHGWAPLLHTQPIWAHAALGLINQPDQTFVISLFSKAALQIFRLNLFQMDPQSI